MRISHILVTTFGILVLLQAETPIKVMRLVLTRSCPGCRMIGVEIQQANLQGADLRNADLRWATLENVDLGNADLSGANLRYARLEQVTTTEHTNFCQAIMPDGGEGKCGALSAKAVENRKGEATGSGF